MSQLCPRCGATSHLDERQLSEGHELRCSNAQCQAVIDSGEPIKVNPRGIGATEAEHELRDVNALEDEEC